MNYSKEELTEYDGKRGFWRTINGRKIFISIEDTKEETKEKIKAFVERKQSNNRLKEEVDEANNEFDKKLNSARDRYKELRDKLQDENLSQEERDKIKEEMDALALFHSNSDRERLEKEFLKKEPSKVKIKKPDLLKEKSEDEKEDAVSRMNVTDPYIKLGEKSEREDLEDLDTINSKGEEYYYRNYAIEAENRWFNGYTPAGQEKHRAEHNEKIRKLSSGNAYLEEKDVKERKAHLEKYKDAEYMAKYYKKLKEDITKHFIDKGRKYNDELLIQNAENYADRYLRERTKKWLIK